MRTGGGPIYQQVLYLHTIAGVKAFFVVSVFKVNKAGFWGIRGMRSHWNVSLSHLLGHWKWSVTSNEQC